MDTVAFEIVPIRHGPYTYEAIRILVNGKRLEELARAVELPFAAAEKHPDLAGDYAPLVLTDISSDPDHFLGTPVASWFEEGDTVLLGCPCGEWGCWPLTVQIEIKESTVRWVGFRNGHRDWDLSGLGPFEFDRTEYLAALTAIG